MAGIDIEPWEPEETVGKLWHKYASRLDAPIVHDGARVDLGEVDGRLAILFRGLGGDPSVEIKPVVDEHSHHRLSLRRRLGTWAETVPVASFDGAALRLPQSLAVLAERQANAALYVWLAAMASVPVEIRPVPGDPLQRDLVALASAVARVKAALLQAPGFRPLYRDLCSALLSVRTTAKLPSVEAAVEAAICKLLGCEDPLGALAGKMVQAIETLDVSAMRAPRGYRPFLPVPLWPELRVAARSEPGTVENRETDGKSEEGGDGPARKARRRKSDQIERDDSFILHKFEAILSWAEFVNLNRRVEDDDNDDARKAADDQDEIGLGQISKAPATRLKLHLDLAPEDVDREAISGVDVYPEWDVRTGAYLPAHARVLSSVVEIAPHDVSPKNDLRSQARIRAVRRQFEALRPGRISTPGHLDGDTLDMERAVRSVADFTATGEADGRIWRLTRAEQRDLSVSILLDVSRSTESAIPGSGHDGRTVIDVERQALAAFAWGLDACGDEFAIHAFSSLKRNRVYVQTAKDFGEPMTSTVEERIASLRPGFYTRLGAAIRHVSVGLGKQAKRRRLLLVITDGKPNDLDHYEGRHGIEDSRMAVREAHRAGHAVYGITVDRNAKSWFLRIFGEGGYTVVSDPDKLITALPYIYRQLVGAGQ
ncbi:MAG: nitric oxide reductase D protein [Rhizobiaceae bacterium]